MKRTLALLLSILLSFSLFHVLPLTSLAEDTVTEEIDVSPAFGEIENWSGKTWFIVRVSSSSPENHLLFGKLEDGYTLKVTVTDETAGKVYGIEKYFFDTPSLEFGGSSYGTYSGGFLRLAVCEYGIVPVSDHAYTVKLEFLSAEGKVAAQGCSDRGAFDSFNASFQNDGPIVPDPIPHPCTPSGPDTGGAEELIIAPAYGEIENYESHTFFVVNVTSGSADNKDLFGKFKPVGGAEAGAKTNARLSLTVTDVLTKKSYVIDDYAFDAPSLEFSAGENSYCGSFLRLDTCKYGVVPQFGHSYTLSLQFYEGDTLIAEGSSAAGAFDRFNDDFLARGAFVPEDTSLFLPEAESTRVLPEKMKIAPYAAGPSGWENWTGSPNLGDYAAVTQLLITPYIGNTYNRIFGKALMDTLWEITLSDRESSKTVRLAPASDYTADTWGIIRFEPCIAEEAENFFAPVKGTDYTVQVKVRLGDRTVMESDAVSGFLCTVDPIVPAEPTPDPEPLRLDANRDGCFSIKDVSAVLRHLERAYLDFVPDYDGSGSAGIGDITVMLQYLSSGEPFSGIQSESAGNVRVQLYSDSVLRVEEKKDGRFCDKETLAVTNREDWEGVSGIRYVGGGKLLLVTEDYTVSLPLDAESASEVFVSDRDGKNLWKYKEGVDAVTYLPAPSETPDSWCFNDTPRVIPSEAKFTPAGAAAGENNGWTEEMNVSDFYIFLPKQNPVALRSNFVSLTGRCELAPVKTLGLWFSRWYPYAEDTVIERIGEFREHGYPFDIFICDTDWRSSSDGTGYTVNTKYFPNIERFFRTAGDNHVYVLFNDHVHPSNLSVLSPEQLNWFAKGITEKLKNGLSAWWYDRNWTNHVQSPFSEIHNDLLGQMMYLYFTKEYRKSIGSSDRSFMLSNIYWNENGSIARQPHVSTHRYSIQWTGDIGSTAQSLKRELENLVYTGAVSSIGYYTSDIGGFTGSPYENLFIRWTQYGALSPIMRYHSGGTDRAPWTVGEKADEVAKKYIQMRYRLLPLLYTLAWENHTLGMPMARRLDFYYPQYGEASANDQYLLGEDILVAPICEADLSGQPVPAAWLETKDGQRGLTGKYYNGTDLSGSPALTRVDQKIDFNWGQNSPGEGVNKDYFSVLWEGKIKVGSETVELGTVSDDGVRVYIDGERIIDNWSSSDSVLTLSGKMLEAGQSYDIRIEYFDNAYDAKIQLMYCAGNRYEKEDTRSVFIPDGTWIDVNNGKEYTGPQTISVSYSVEQSPVFVKKGSVLLLAPTGEYADTANWKELTVDLYPGQNTDDTTVLYEDDGTTEAYQTASAYRSTAFRAVCGEDGITVTVTPEISGAYAGSFDERTYTLRIHGGDYTSLAVNGKTYSLSEISADGGAAPFALTGAAADGNILTVRFTADVNEPLTLTVK